MNQSLQKSQPRKITTKRGRRPKHVYNHAKLRILYAIYTLQSERKQASALPLHELLPDMRLDSLRQRLLDYYLVGYLKRSMVPKKKTTTKKTRCGWSTRESFKYKLNEKGERIMWQLAFRYKEGLDLNLHRRNPKRVNYYKHWTEEDIRKAGITEETLEKYRINSTGIKELPDEGEGNYKNYSEESW